jgi:hypothetical protein
VLSATTIGRVWWKLKMRLESLGHAVPVLGCSLDVIFPVNLSTFPASHFLIRNKSQMDDSYTYLTQRSNHVCGIAVSKFYLIEAQYIRSIESEDPNWQTILFGMASGCVQGMPKIKFKTRSTGYLRDLIANHASQCGRFIVDTWSSQINLTEVDGIKEHVSFHSLILGLEFESITCHSLSSGLGHFNSSSRHSLATIFNEGLFNMLTLSP